LLKSADFSLSIEKNLMTYRILPGEIKENQLMVYNDFHGAGDPA
jgi:hypothetical protein